MNSHIEAHREELNQLCQRFQVSRLELFGSAATGDFEESSSDLDFLVDFHPMSPGSHARAYFGLLEALREMFQCNIDLVEIGAIRNPYFQASVDRTRLLLYSA